MRAIFFLVALAVAVLGVAPASAQQVTAEHFAREPQFRSASLSPDGRYVAAIQQVEQGDALVIIDWRTRQARAIQLARRDRFLFLDMVAWKTDNRLLFVLRQRAEMRAGEVTGSRMGGMRSGDFEFDVTRVFAVGPDGANLTQMFEGQTRRLAADVASISLISALPRDPENVLLGTYGTRGYSLFRANVATGRTEEVATGGWETGSFEVDGTGEAVIRLDFLPNNSGHQIFRRGPGERRWELAHEVRRATVAQGRDFTILGPGPGAGQVYVAARPEGQEFQAIYLYDTANGTLGQPVFAQDQADAGYIALRADNSLLFGCAERTRLECRTGDARMQRHLEAIDGFFGGEGVVVVRGVSNDGGYWLLSVSGPRLPPGYYVYDVANTRIEAVASAYPHMPRSALSPTEIVRYPARDGTELWGYLTRPEQASAGAAPLVVLPHGGPESRDSYGYDFFVQFLASRGYMVFQPNFRGSEGSGRSFAEAGYRQWGRLMQDDVTDGVRHLVSSGAADARRICIVGISYGGYAALAGVSLTPDLYRCAISIAGDSDLIELLDLERQASGRGSTNYAYWRRLVGDPGSDRDNLIAVSPRRQVQNINAPILLMHGTQDDIVFPQQSARMRDALQSAGKTVRYVEFEGEGHPWTYWERGNVQRMLEESERFLAQHLGQ